VWSRGLSDEGVEIQKSSLESQIRSVILIVLTDIRLKGLCMYTIYLLCTNLQIYLRNIYETREKYTYIAFVSRGSVEHVMPYLA
jgi:hypothetical protein